MAKAKKGDKVRIHYNGFLDDGSIFESTISEEPFEFILGEGRILSSVESEIFGMSAGETKTVVVPPEKACGHYNGEEISVIDKAQIPSDIEPEVGMTLNVQTAKDEVKKVTVTDITEKTVTLDGNHPLAGKTLTFEVHLLKIF